MKINRLILSVALSLTALSGTVTQAQEKATDKEAITAITGFVKGMSDKAEIGGIYTTGINDLYQVLIKPADVIYVNKTLDKIFVDAQLLDLKNQVDLTQLRKEEALRFDFKELPKTGYITYGNGKDEIAIFADPNCVFCKKLEKNLEGANDLKIRVYPVAILSPSSVDLNKNIMCSANPKKAWKDWMINNIKPVDVKECKVDFKVTKDFIDEKMINSTPTIILANGKRLQGAMELADLRKEIAATKVKKK